MGQIRRQVIYSTVITYIGFLIGLVTTYLFIRNGTFTPEQYGLTRVMSDIGTTMFSFATFGVMNYVYKFYPYYKANLKPEENDQPAISLLLPFIGFVLVCLAAIFLQPLIIRKFSAKSPMLVHYFYWLLPFTFGLLFFSVLEVYAWFAQKSWLSNLLKETALRFFQLVLMVAFICDWLSFSVFLKLFVCGYVLMAAILFVRLRKAGMLNLTLRPSRVTRRLSRKIITFMATIHGSFIVFTLAQYIDGIIIAGVSPRGLADAGVFTLAGYIANTIQVPQRSIVSATVPALSHAWREKNIGEISRLYKRSSINLLLLSLFIFVLIWMNIDEVFRIFNVNTAYQAGYWVVLILSISRIIDAGTGVNGQIITTSNRWRFDLTAGVILLALSMPLNYALVKRYGIEGSAIANLIAFGIYNSVRVWFLWRNYRLQPFSMRSLWAVLVAAGLYFGCRFLFLNIHGIPGIFLRSAVFGVLFFASVFLFDLTPDARQLLEVVRRRLGFRS